MHNRTEEEWRLIALKWIPTATKLWFEWIEWAVVMGALYYAYERSKNWAVVIALGVSNLMLMMYFTSLFSNLITYKSFSFLKSDRASFRLAIVISVAATLATTTILRTVVAELSMHPD